MNSQALVGNRKLIAVVVLLVLGVGAVFLRGDVPPNFLSLAQFLFGAFVVGNGVEHLAGAATDIVSARVPSNDDSAAAAPAPLAPPVDLSPVHSALADVQAQNAATQQGVAIVQQTLTHVVQRMNNTGFSASQ